MTQATERSAVEQSTLRSRRSGLTRETRTRWSRRSVDFAIAEAALPIARREQSA